MSKLEKILKGVSQFNEAIPDIVGIVLTLKNGAEINVFDLIEETTKITEETIAKADAALARPASHPAPEGPGEPIE